MTDAHNFMDLNVAGNMVRSCVYCHAVESSPQGKEPCPNAKHVNNSAAEKALIIMSAGTDFVALVASLDADAIAARIEALTGEIKALRVLLRSARAKRMRKISDKVEQKD